MGTVTLKCEINNKCSDVKFQVIHQKARTIFGSETCVQMGLVKKMFSVDTQKQDVIEKFPEVFDGIGCLPGKHKIHVDKTVTPVVHPPRKVPIKLKDKVLQELKRMENEKIIVKETEPTDWVNSMVTVVKPDGTIRICIDPKDLNKAIKRHHYPLKTVEEVIANMPGAQFFSKLDAVSSFWQIELDEESSKLCTFNTPFGRYRYLRLPFGVHSAPEVMQQVMSQIVEGIEGTEVIMDDILISGKTMEEHDKRLEAVLTRAKENNLKFKKEKCQFRKTEVSYVGHLLTKDGVKPDREKVRAVEEMKAPTNKSELQTFLGFIQYLAKFIPNLSQKTEKLRVLLQKKIVFAWGHEQQKCFEELKELVTNAPVLQYFDSKQPITLTVDSSSKAVGAALMQNGKPVAFASQALTPTQQRYSQIEKETLAIVFGCRKFRQYIYGQKVTIESDHKPLQMIFKKGLHETPLRLQRMLHELSEYCLDVTYKPGKTMYVADTLSRNYMDQKTESLWLDDYSIAAIENYVSMSQQLCQEIKSETEKDTELKLLKEMVHKGWPDERQKVPEEIRMYWNYRDEITVIDSLVMKGQKVVIPKSMRNKMLNYVHESHMGIVKSKAMARESMFWPTMNAAIEDKIAKCEKCAKSQAQNPKEPMLCMDVPDMPYSKVSIDIFEMRNHQYLLSVDYFSKWPEISRLDNMTSKNVIAYLKSHFSRYGIPEEVISDNARQFTSREFAEFARNYGFKHTTSSPYHYQSHGQVERTVRTVKNLLKKAEDPYIAMLNYRNTPMEGIGLSPAQMLMGRSLRTKLPVARENLKSKQSEEVQEKLRQKQNVYKKYYDEHAGKPLKQLAKGQNVMFRRHNAWEPGKIQKFHELPRSYLIQSPEGKYFRRNRRQIRPTKVTFTQTLPEEDYIPTSAPAENQPEPTQQQTQGLQQHQQQQPTGTTPYVTRSGRTVKPPDRFQSS